jgi:hypothetical protein
LIHYYSKFLRHFTEESISRRNTYSFTIFSSAQNTLPPFSIKSLINL